MVQRRELLRSAGAGLLLKLIPPAAWAIGQMRFVDVRLWPAEDYTRVTLEHEGSLQYKHFLVEGPWRLVVDILDMRLDRTLKDLAARLKADDPYVSQIRVGQFDPNTVRIVFDLKTEVRPEIFNIEPVAGYKNRFVVDFYPKNPKDPMVALFQQSDGLTHRRDEIERALELAGSVKSSEAASGFEKKTSPVLKGEQKSPDKSVDALLDKILEQSPDKSTDQFSEKRADKSVDKHTDKPLDKAVEKGTEKGTEKGSTDKSSAQKPNADQDRTASQKAKRLITVAVDPGHGGEDPGAVGSKGTKEKDIVLAISRFVKEELESQEGYRVLLTRNGDFFVPLNQRVQKARSVNADLFVSIHADAFIKPSARGSSVFVLSDRGASSTAAKWLANKENASDLIGGVNIRTKDSQLAKVLLDLSTTAQINDSLKLGGAVLGKLGKINRLHKTHVEQAGFAVLKAPDIPSILVETAFISNPEEEEKLRSVEHQRSMAKAIAQGILQYFAKNPPVAYRPLA